MSYKSPIAVIAQNMAAEFDGEVMRAVTKYGVIVDKEELEKALRYDRDQYEKGYADRDAAITRCLHCSWSQVEGYSYEPCQLVCLELGRTVSPDFYCKYGRPRFEEKEEGDE